jgi:hypothetical protein
VNALMFPFKITRKGYLLFIYPTSICPFSIELIGETWDKFLSFA